MVCHSVRAPLQYPASVCPNAIPCPTPSSPLLSRQIAPRNARISRGNSRSMQLPRACTVAPESARHAATAPLRCDQPPRCPILSLQSHAPRFQIPREDANPTPRSHAVYLYNELAPRFGARPEHTIMPTRLAKRKTPPRNAKAKALDRPAQWKSRRRRGLQILESPSLARITWLTHGFSTRPGGASELALKHNASEAKKQCTAKKVLNLGFTEWDSRERVLENRAKFFAALDAGESRVAALRQIHSDIVHVVGAAEFPQGEQAPKGDALITREPGVLLTIQTADCIPILLADTKQRAIAAIHSGWRGTAQRIAEKTLGRMQMEFGTRPEDVIAALGPGIGRCCYEVGSEVARDFDAQFPSAREWFDGPFDALASGENDPNWLPWLTMKPPGHQPPPLRVHLDLIAANRAILAAAGIPARQISSSGLCTACRTDLLFSYRRERTTGRMMAAIGIR